MFSEMAFTVSEKDKITVPSFKSRTKFSSTGLTVSSVKLSALIDIKELFCTGIPNMSLTVAEVIDKYVLSIEVAKFVSSLIWFKSVLPSITSIIIPSGLFV